LTIATVSTTRANIIIHASRMPAASASLAGAVRSVRLWRAKLRLTAVDDTSPPVRPVMAVPRALPSQRTAT
jgi:hypothetical protein